MNKYIKYLFLIIQIFISDSFAASQFIEQFQTEPLVNSTLADRVTEYYSDDISLSLNKQKTELLKIENQLNTIENKFSDNAVYWFIRGLHHRNMASYYIAAKNPALSRSHIEHKDKAYAKALALSKTKGKELSAAIYSTMKHGLPQNLKITATQNEISQGGNGDNDSYYWYLHWSNINQLQKAGRKKEAEDAYQAMQKELKASGMDMSVYNSLTKQIETQTLHKQPANTQKTAPKKQPPKVKKKTTERKNKDDKMDSKYIIISSIAAFSAISLIIVIIIELKRKRKKQK